MIKPMKPTIENCELPESKLIPVNGIELEVFDAGRQNAGKPIVFLHGLPEHAFTWCHQNPILVEAGYHVIAPNQRGYGNSSRPANVIDYDIENLTVDLTALLDYYGYQSATFIGHDWGAMVTWWKAQLNPKRVKQLIALAVPYQVRGDTPWIEWVETFLGIYHYFVHFNRQPGVADAILDENAHQFLSNLFRENSPQIAPEPGMVMINLAKSKEPQGAPIMPDDELAVFTSAFKTSGFTGRINWYRNLDRNWHLLTDVNPIIEHPALMIYREQDMIPKFEGLSAFVPNVEEVSIDCSHWIQQEKPEETNQAILSWLEKNQD